MNKKKSITILCPVFNEEESVARFVAEFKRVIQGIKHQYSFDFLFADNCSTDNTLNCLIQLQREHSNIRIIKYSRNFGVMKSIFTGIVNTNSNACIVFDCDLQDPPELIIEFIKAWEVGAKIVYGERRRREEGYLISFLRKRYRKIETGLKGYKVTVESGAWLLDERVINELRDVTFEPYLAGLISRLGFKTVGIPYDRGVRIHGISKFGLSKYFAYAADGLVSGTITPLRVAVFSGIIFSLLSFILAGYFVIAKLLLGLHFAEGIAAIIVIQLFGFGLTFLFLGVIGEYVGRLYLAKESSQLAIIEKSYPIKKRNKN